MPAEVDFIPEGPMVQVAQQLRALGRPARLRLIELPAAGPSTPQGLGDALGLSQQNVSKHIPAFHRAVVVSRRPDGADVFYALVDTTAVGI